MDTAKSSPRLFHEIFPTEVGNDGAEEPEDINAPELVHDATMGTEEEPQASGRSQIVYNCPNLSILQLLSGRYCSSFEDPKKIADSLGCKQEGNIKTSMSELP